MKTKCLNCDSFDVYDEDDRENCLNCDFDYDLFDEDDEDDHVEDDDH